METVEQPQIEEDKEIKMPETKEELLAMLEQAKMEGATLMGRTVQDRIGNAIALTGGYAELAMIDPQTPPRVKVQLAEAVEGVTGVGKVLDLIGNIDQLVTKVHGGEVMIDLEASARVKKEEDKKD